MAMYGIALSLFGAWAVLIQDFYEAVCWVKFADVDYVAVGVGIILGARAMT
jgi:hypothetical protein